uniref:Uncharacterized protein n=1 Tax=Oryza brachyantha TaxID=4533 RepID=J3MAX4_ORYBR
MGNSLGCAGLGERLAGARPVHHVRQPQLAAAHRRRQRPPRDRCIAAGEWSRCECEEHLWTGERTPCRRLAQLCMSHRFLTLN